MKKHEKVSLVIFDMDGLMFDTERISIGAWQKAGASYNIKIHEETIVKTIGLNIIETERVFKEDLGEDLLFQKLKSGKMKNVLEYVKQNGMPVKKGFYETIKDLKKRGIKTAIATSSERERVETYLSYTNINDEFDTIVCGDEVQKGKPEPDIFLEAAKRVSCKPEECMVLEDSDNGLIAAYNAGMIPVYIEDIKRPQKSVLELIYKELESLFDVTGLLDEMQN
jgi:HAD superfamily hydrolase (TIGR01509 family)